MDFSLIIPCYNEEGNVEAFFEEAEKVLDLAPISYEYVFVNDGSTDSTQQRLKELFEKHPNKSITVINFSRNFGKESAIFAGLKNSTGNAVCLIDADLQQHPKTAYQMYLGFDGPLTYKNAKKTVEVARIVPLERVLLETDSPYMSPVPVRGTRNDSRNVFHIAAKFAELRGMEVDEVIALTSENGRRFFGIE